MRLRTREDLTRTAPFIRPLRVVLLRGSTATPRAGWFLESAGSLTCPRHVGCFRCATDTAPLRYQFDAVSLTPASKAGSEGNFVLGGCTGPGHNLTRQGLSCGDSSGRPFSTLASRSFSDLPHTLKFLSFPASEQGRRGTALNRGTQRSRGRRAAAARGMTRAGRELSRVSPASGPRRGP